MGLCNAECRACGISDAPLFQFGPKAFGGAGIADAWSPDQDDPESLHDMTQATPVTTEMPSPTSPGSDDDEDRITGIVNHKL
ncbi:hypothetical protein AK812_SmicGene39710 [Symbiodinium microadriaticum]|uniref:Uncharacterized protein n=1 Tax=Symbiodinium microadriaticum TaxID=2951 RepID=A0A1Q9CAI2_SYMMI|nr:hypothetical protein AK812_SmicGene39710 [Symbiodinium microadriaticum]